MGSTTGGSRINETSLLQILLAINTIAPGLVEVIKNKDAVISAAKLAYTVSEEEKAKSQAIKDDIAKNQKILDGLSDQIVYVNNATKDLGDRETALQKSHNDLDAKSGDIATQKAELTAAIKSHELDAQELKSKQEELFAGSIQFEMDKTSFAKEKADFRKYADKVKETAKQLSGFTSKLDI